MSQSKMVRSTRDREFKLGQSVSVRDYRNNDTKWIPGVINEKTGPVSYRVEIAPDVNWKRHADQIHDSKFSVGDGNDEIVDLRLPDNQDENSNPSVNSEVISSPVPVVIPEKPKTPAQLMKTPSAERRYPLRERKKPIRLDL